MDTATDKRTPAIVLPPGLRKALTIGLCVALIAAAGYWLYRRHTHVFSEDARIAASMIDVSAKTAGQVVEFPVTQGDVLEPGTLIAQQDDRSAQFGLQELEAELKAMDSARERLQAQIGMVDQETGGKLHAAQSQLEAALASSAFAKSDLEYKRGEWERAQSLRKRQILSEQQWENARNAFQQSDQLHQRAQAEADSARAMVVEAEAGQSQLQVLASELRGIRHERDRALASLDKQRILIGDMRITSPVHGTIDQTFVHAGEYVVPGQRLVLMHNPKNIWIDANIKETEIRRIAIGNHVEVSVDAYPDRTFDGKVVRIGNSATSAFSLLPNTNPGGNFTKVTQRLPVKISIEQSDGLLRPGMMVEIAIDAD